jgi:hypothetical protein
MFTHAECLSAYIAELSDEFRTMPEWAQRLIADRTPYLASDPTFCIDWEFSMDGFLHFRSRGFYYYAIEQRWFIS